MDDAKLDELAELFKKASASGNAELLSAVESAARDYIASEQARVGAAAKLRFATTALDKRDNG